MDNVYIKIISLPPGINEVVSPCSDGYMVYIAEQLSESGRLAAYNHAMTHIANNDFCMDNVQEIEARAHGLTA